MKAEEYFFRYAYPCSETLVRLGKLNRERKEVLDKEFKADVIPTKLELEECFPAAFGRIKKLAKEMKRDYWDIVVIRKYFQEEHNKYIDADDGDYKRLPPAIKDVCKVYISEVLDVKGNILLVKYDHKERSVINKYLKDLKIGDKVTIHFGFAIEKV